MKDEFKKLHHTDHYEFTRNLLSKRQKEYVRFIETYQSIEGKWPTYEEIGKHFKRSNSTIHHVLNRNMNCKISYSSRIGIRFIDLT